VANKLHQGYTKERNNIVSRGTEFCIVYLCEHRVMKFTGVVLALEGRRKDSNAPSVRSQVVELRRKDEAMSLVYVSSLSSLQYFDTGGWVARRTSGP